MLDTLDRLILYQHKGLLLLDQSCKVLSKNQFIDRLIKRACEFKIHKREILNSIIQQDNDVKYALKDVKKRLIPTTIFLRDSNISHPLRLDILPIYDEFIINEVTASLMIVIEVYEPSEIIIPNQFADFYQLTKVELIVVELLIQGMNTKECAQLRGRSVSTIRWTLRNIFKKTNTNSQKELISLAALFMN